MVMTATKLPPRTGLAWPRLVYEYAVFYGCLFVFAVSSLAWSLPAALLYVVLPRRIGEPLGQFMIMAGFRYFLGVMRLTGLIRCEVAALDRLRPMRPSIIAANHPALLDAVLVLSRLPRTVCIMKPEIWDNLFLGGGARLAGYIRNDAPLGLVKRAGAQVAAGHHLLIFPEGTRSVRRPVGPFKGGFALIARQAGVDVQTVFIESNTPFLGKGWPLFRKPAFPLVYRIRLGRRFPVASDLSGFVADLQDYFSRELASAGSAEPGA